MSTSTVIEGSTSPSALRRLVARHPVATFLIMAYTVSITLMFIRLQTDGNIQSPSYEYFVGFLEHLLSVAFPAFLVVAALQGKDGVRDLAIRSLRWRVGARWYIIPLLVIPIASLLGASIIYGVTTLNTLVDRWQVLVTLILPSLLIRVVFLNTLEEIGWLGFLQARLQDEYGPWKACLLVEIPFALWHLPGLLGDTGGHISLALMLGGIFAVFQLCGRFVNMWLYNSSHRSVLPAALFHANFNTTINVYADNFIPVPAESWFFIVSGMLAAAAILIVIFTKGRLSYKPNDAPQTAAPPLANSDGLDYQSSLNTTRKECDVMSSMNLSPNPRPEKQAARIATIAMMGISYFLIAVIALHFLRNDYDPVSRFVSEYAVGSYGFLMTSAFFGLSFGSLALVMGLYQGVSRSARSWIGLILLGIWGASVLIAGIFPTALKGAPATPSDNIHALASLISFLSLIPATILLSRRFKHDEKWRPLHRSALILSLVILGTFIGFFLTFETEFAGLSQRIFIATFLIWLLLTAAHLRFIALASVSNS